MKCPGTLLQEYAAPFPFQVKLFCLEPPPVSGSARTHQHMSGLRIQLPAALYAFLFNLEHLLRSCWWGFKFFFGRRLEARFVAFTHGASLRAHALLLDI